MLSCAEHEKSFITSGPDLLHDYDISSECLCKTQDLIDFFWPLTTTFAFNSHNIAMKALKC